MRKNTDLPTGVKTRKKKKFTLDDVQLFFLSLPTVIWYLIFCYLPMFGLVIAFKNYRVAPGKGFLYSLFYNSKWSGLDNFRFLFANNKATTLNMFRNTVGYNIIFIILGVVLPVTLAIMINHLHSQKLAKVTQTAMFLPHFLSWVVVGYFVFAFLSTDNGLVNRTLQKLGIDTVKWYQKDAIGYWPFFLIFLHVWKTIGYSMVVYLSSIKGIDASLYEAAMIDGANGWNKFTNITLPLLSPVTFYVLITSLIGGFQVFVEVQVMTPNGGPNYSSATVVFYLYEKAFTNGQLGYGSAVAVILATIIFIITAINFWGQDKWVKTID